MMYIYGNLDYPVVVVSDLRIKSNESLGLVISFDLSTLNLIVTHKLLVLI